MGIVLALTAALAYGLSDFVGGIASRRTTPWPVALLAGVGGLAGAIALAVAFPGDPTRADLLWGALSGVGGGAGSAFLYRGFATGRMGVVAPVSAVGAAVVPVVVGVASGERPGALVWLGIAAALPGIW
ncbi:EamA family transporter, partial [Nocardioides sp.]